MRDIVKYFVVGMICFGVVEGDRTFTKVYEPIKGTAACFKRLNGTHEIGCRSSSKGEVGVLHVVEDQDSLDWVLKTGPHAPYIAILYPSHFTSENLQKFGSSGRVNGVLMLPPKENKPPSKFSPDSSCPNHQFGFYNASSPKFCHAWNPSAQNPILFQNFEFPIFFVKNETEARNLTKCYETFNKPVNGTAQNWPLCAGQLSSFMMAAKDTPTCIRRSSVFSINPGTAKVCDPLGDQNVWASLLPQNTTDATNDTKSALILATRFDGASVFDEMSPSADTSITGLVTLLAVIKHLASVRDQLVISPDAQIDSVYFMLFNGEAFGYIGSSRIAYDMNRGQFPLKFEDIRYYLELNQLAPRGSSEEYFYHQSEQAQSKEFTDLLVETCRLQNVSLKNPVTTPTSPGLPPSSLHSFLRHRKNLTGVVLTNHQDAYQNPYYNSIFDTSSSLNYKYGDESVTSIQQKLASLAASITNTTLQLLQADPSIKITPDLETIDELLHCYLETSNCSLFHAISGFDPSPNSPMHPYPMYVGVSAHTNTLTQLTRYLLVTFLGTPVENATNEKICFETSSAPRYFINGTCYDCPEVNMTEAKSPAFIIPDYDWSSGEYSTWTESVWQKFSVRIFLKPSLLHEVITLVSGILVVIVSFLGARFISGKAELIFPSRADAIVC